MMFLRAFVFLLLSLVLIGCAVVWSGLDLTQLWRRLATVPVWLVSSFVVLTTIQIVLSAYKWRFVVQRLAPTEGPKGLSFFLACTAASALLSQVLTSYVSSTVVRGWAGRRFHNMPVLRGVGSSVFEQMFDVIVLISMALGTVVTWMLGGGLGAWLLWTGFSVLGGLIVSAQLKRLLPMLRRLHPKLSQHRMLGDDAGLGRLCSSSAVFVLYGLSVLRYIVMLVRAPLVVIALGYAMSLIDTSQGFTIVQTTQLAAFTPGNLGLQEWGWSGVLGVLGYPFEGALEFALVLRVVGLTSMIIAAPILLAPVFLRRTVIA